MIFSNPGVGWVLLLLLLLLLMMMMMMVVVMDRRETTFLWQRMSILMQWFSAILISETFINHDKAPDL